MERTRIIRSLRIAVSVLCLVAFVLLVALWVLSYSRRVAVWCWYPPHGYYVQATSDRGAIYLSHLGNNVGPSFRLGGSFRRTSIKTPMNWSFDSQHYGSAGIDFTYTIPHWFPVILSAVFAIPILPWVKWRFSLRTLLIATTIIAVVLGIIAASM